ncbi:helix-turn-helix domain-containing protein [Streptomyces violaceusniger]|uniref:Peptidoglycan-binding domain 1 protein n=1 Tax=Streptomyces violaceusniger (strain Tu 4113) TaxID=653045 RepID=G2NYN6_STRV4|nr:helix-turn-helix domain-containing protein [Streptomyces violaceusniger]AEM82103.1 Peptidoglycan-binding domain 1 protein [Streptomyces violaceusniger Tu 4113]
MSGTGDVEEFAELLRELKGRTNRSYAALAARSGVSGSALHRYCSGTSVPGDYELIARFGKVCGASGEELLELHRRWVLADAERKRDVSRAPAAVSAAPTGPAGSAIPAVSRVETGAALDAETGAGAEPEPERLALVSASVPAPAPAPEPGADPPPWRRRPLIAVLALAVLTAGAAVVLLAGKALTSSDGSDGSSDDRLLLSSRCPVVVSMGQADACVHELQSLLARAGGELDIDGAFGPATQMRVVVFQLRSGLTANGSVDERTKRALYENEGKPLDTWTPERVTRRIREVFTEDPERAVGIADCASYLDPLYTLPNSNATRNWGVFQLYDGTLRKLGGTREQALDPDWNIRAAHRLWALTHDFSAWKACDRAYRAGSKGVQGAKGR